MIEAVWTKNNKEVDWVDRVVTIIEDSDPLKVRVYNGSHWYQAGDGAITKNVDGFFTRAI